MNRARRAIASASFTLSAALILWAVGATLYMIPIWRSDIAIAAPPANLKPEELAAANIGALFGAALVLVMRVLVGVMILLQGLLGFGLGLAARALGRGRRSGRWLLLTWSILALLIELPLLWLVASSLRTMTGSLLVLSIATAAYAFVILILEPFLRAPGSRPLKKPMPILGDFA